jgi:hypothetical protein
MSDSRLSPWSRRDWTRFCASVHIPVEKVKLFSARFIAGFHRLGINLKIGNCSDGRYVPGLMARFN